ncbi:MAG: PilZ domain-containing protein [Oleibacter sp.]|nr:PilZ domain-containing protein [Thalassolituus sp.]
MNESSMNQDKDFAEMRMEPRWILKSTVSVFEHSGNDCLGFVVNWSTGGLMLYSYQCLPKGTEMHVDIVDILNDTDHRIATCNIEVLWSREFNQSMFGQGCKIVSKSDIFDNMMKDYCIN